VRDLPGDEFLPVANVTATRAITVVLRGRTAKVLAAEALFGLAVLASQLSIDRLGRCVAPGCGQVFVDTSANRSRRYCSTRCATRVDVATHRRKAAVRRPQSEPT
jgi:predicted RNA-binding Zn ribbon-like protein